MLAAAMPRAVLETILNPDHHSHSEHAHVPFARFFLWTGGQFVLAVLLFRWLAPAMFAHEIARPWLIVLWTFLFGIPLSLFEYLYHRYLLHSSVLPFLNSMHRAHGQHHSLTYVKAPVKPDEPATLVEVRSEFPVVHEHQEESMMFPVYAIAIFLAVFGIILALPAKLTMPAQPMILATILSVTLYYSAYELWHAVMHLPYDKVWQPLMEHRRVGRVVRFVYGFHLMHHWRPSANLAVVGFWGFAMWDHLFRTHRRPQNIPLAGAAVNFTDASLKKPLWPIAMMDRWQSALYRWSRKVERWAARVFLRRASPAE